MRNTSDGESPNAYFLVSDYSADCPSQAIESRVPLILAKNTISFGDETLFVDELTMEDIFNRIDHENTFPKTSAPPFDEFLRIYQQIMTEHPETTHVLSLHPPPTLSATFKTAEEAKHHLPPEQGARIHVINTHQGSVGLGLLLQDVISFIQHYGPDSLPNPHSFTRIIEQWGKTIALFGVIKTLDYLLKGGRIGRAKYFVASLLNYQPMFQLLDDEVTPLGRTRDRKKALEKTIKYTIEHVQADLEHPFNTILIGHVLAEPEASYVAKRVKEHLPNMKIEITNMGTLVGIHTGPGTIALAFHVKEPPLP